MNTRASRDRLTSSPSFLPPPSGHRSERLATLAPAKKKHSAKAALAQPEASPRTTEGIQARSLATLRNMLRRLIDEKLAAREVDVDRAAALADAVCDLRVVIARLDTEVSAAPASTSRQTAAALGIGARAASPQVGDILIRGLTTDCFELVEITTRDFLSGPIHGFPAALAAARARHPRAIWQQHTDERGRPLTDAFRLPDL